MSTSNSGRMAFGINRSGLPSVTSDLGIGGVSVGGMKRVSAGGASTESATDGGGEIGGAGGGGGGGNARAMATEAPVKAAAAS